MISFVIPAFDEEQLLPRTLVSLREAAERLGEEFEILVVDDASDRVLGCHMVGEDAPEIVQGLAIAMACGATKAQFDATVAIHPTAAEEFVLMRSPVDS